MSVESVLDQAFTVLLAKARQRQLEEAAQAPAARPATLHFGWGGGGQPIDATACDPYLLEVPFPATLVSAHLWAGDANGNPVAVSATVDVRLTQLGTFGSTIALYGGGAIPRLTTQSTADLSMAAWQTNLLGTDAIIARLATFTGTATWIELVLRLLPSEVDLGLTTVVDSAGNTMVDSAGNVLVIRS